MTSMVRAASALSIRSTYGRPGAPAFQPSSARDVGAAIVYTKAFTGRGANSGCSAWRLALHAAPSAIMTLFRVDLRVHLDVTLPAHQRVMVPHQQLAHQRGIGDHQLVLRPHAQVHQVAILRMLGVHRIRHAARHARRQAPAGQTGGRSRRPGAARMEDRRFAGRLAAMERALGDVEVVMRSVLPAFAPRFLNPNDIDSHAARAYTARPWLQTIPSLSCPPAPIRMPAHRAPATPALQGTMLALVSRDTSHMAMNDAQRLSHFPLRPS